MLERVWSTWKRQLTWKADMESLVSCLSKLLIAICLLSAVSSRRNQISCWTSNLDSVEVQAHWHNFVRIEGGGGWVDQNLTIFEFYKSKFRVEICNFTVKFVVLWYSRAKTAQDLQILLLLVIFLSSLPVTFFSPLFFFLFSHFAV